MQSRIVLLFFSLIIGLSLSSQNTVGLIDYQPWNNSYDGINLIYPHNQSSVFLIDNCGRVIHEWEDDEIYRPGNTAYLTEEGILIKAKKIGSLNIPIWTIDGETIIEARDWENNLLWRWRYLNENSRLHHDFEITPSGSILAIAWDHYTIDQAISAGRDSSLMAQAAFSPDKIIEYDPIKDSIIWEWKAWDHIIQDRDPNKPHYGIVAEHPEKIDINWENNNLRADWMHVNAIDYLPELDQILINVPTFNEMWIIDHSTTTTEAEGSSGGLSGKGGDLLWRWGNPATYDQGDSSNQKMFFQHDASWINDFQVADKNQHYGAISFFNNGKEQGHSSVELLRPAFDSLSWSYLKTNENTFLPESSYFSWQHEEENIIYSTGLSSVQVLPNDNLLVCSGRNGRSIELNQDHKIVWDFITPTRNGIFVPQGTELVLNNNLTFRIRRYPLDYSGFNGKELSPIRYLELEPNEAFCEKILPTSDIDIGTLELYPNPVESYCHIKGPFDENEISVISIHGKIVSSLEKITSSDEMSIDLSELQAGIYFIRSGKFIEKIIKL